MRQEKLDRSSEVGKKDVENLQKLFNYFCLLLTSPVNPFVNCILEGHLMLEKNANVIISNGCQLENKVLRLSYVVKTPTIKNT